MNARNTKRFVILYWSGSEFEGGDVVVPAEYESAEALLCDFEAACEAAFTAKESGFTLKSDFTLGGYEFSVDDFISRDFDSGKITRIWPTILTIDEWFEQCPQGKVQG